VTNELVNSKTLEKPNLLIRYRFKGDSHYSKIWLTETQFTNFREIPIIERCEIISDLSPKNTSKKLKKLISQ
jgi:hypothetical protein